MEALFAEAKAAEVLGVASATLRKWRCSGAGPPFIRVGASIRYRRSALDAWLDGHTFRTTTEADHRPGVVTP